MGRQKTGKPTKELTVHTRLTDDERRTLALMAGQERLKVSAMLRALIREGARHRGILPSEGELHAEGVVFEP